MWPRKRYAIVFLLGIGLLSAFLGASGQDQRLPWPPRPVQPPDSPVIVETTPRSQPQNTDPPVPLPPSVTEPGTIVQVSAPPKEMEQNPSPPMLPDIPAVLPDPPPPAPPVVVVPPPETIPAKIVEPEPKSTPVVVPNPAPPVTLPEPAPKPAIPDLPIPKPVEIPKPLVTPPDGPISPPVIETPKQLKPNPPKTITIAPSAPAPQIKEQPPEPPQPPKFRIVAPIRKAPVQPADPPPLPPPTIPRETFTPPRPAFEVPPVLSGTQTPLLTFDKKGPAAVQLNQTARFEIVVRNAGSVTAHKVQVEDELPAGARFVGGDPMPVLRGDRVTWVLDTLPAGAERRLAVDLQATIAADMATNTTVTVSATKMARTNVSGPALSLSIKGPSGAAVGKPVVFEIEMANNGHRPLANLVLQAIVPPGLTHPLGERIEADVSDLPPLTSKSFPLQTTAAKPGRHTIHIKILTQDGKEVSAQAVVVISEAGVGIRPAGTSRLMLDREGEIQVELANYTNRPARNVVVTDSVPEGLAFIDASDRGLYRASTRSVYWMVDHLEAGQTKTLTMKVRPHSPGEYSHQAIAKTEEGQESKVVSAVVVESLPNLQMKVSSRDNPVEVGRQAVYEIRVENQGSAAATGVRISALVPDGMRFAAARGPTAYGVQGQQVIFEPLPRLDSRKQMIFEIAALAQSAGDRRLRVQVTSDQVQVPMAREERTWVFD